MNPLQLGSFVLAAAAGLSGVLTAQVMPEPTWSTYYGATAFERPTWRGIERLPNGTVVVGGTTTTATPTYDGLVACFDPSGAGSAQCLWSMSIAAAGNDEITGLCVTADGDVLVCGWSGSSSLSTTPGCYQPALAGGGHDAFVARLDGQTGAVLCLTYFGGVDGDFGRAVEVMSTGDLVITGVTNGTLPVGACPSY